MAETENLLKARAAFVKIIKDENFYSNYCKQSLRQHWAGAKAGFADEAVQRRWRDFLAGWRASNQEEGKQ